MIHELKQLDTMIRARYPIIYIISWEEFRVIEKISELFENDRDIYVWSITHGFRKFNEYQTVNDATRDPINALNFIDEIQCKGIFILNGFHSFLDSQNFEVIRSLYELSESLKVSKKNIIIISPLLNIPIELQKNITIIDFPLPEQSEIMEIFDRIKYNIENQNKLDLSISEKETEQIIKALTGLTRKEIENVLFKSLVERKEFSIEVIIREKEQIIRKTGILEYFHPVEQIQHIGGLNDLKIWIKKRKNAFMDRAREFGLPYPKGLLLIGIQGCGKSLTCKVIANLWNFPLLRLDVGAIFQGIVGSSESNIRKSIKIAESIAPCVLWIDEIEKGFSGIKSSNISDAGTTARVFGTFVTWMQEKEKPVFIVATANDISALPPELLRKGRFDEIFFIDLPTTSERIEIFNIHLDKRNRDPKNFNIEVFAEKTRKFSGAEIESVIISALYDAFDDNLKNSQSDLNNDYILESIQNTIPLSNTMEEKINRMRNWASNRARPANKKETTLETKYQLEI